MNVNDHVTGLPELYQFYQTLPVKIERNHLRGALRAGMTATVKPAAQRAARRASGLYADGLKVGTKSRGGVVTANLKAKGKHGYLGAWIEYGTRAHNIAAKKGGWLSFLGVFRKDVEHPGAKSYPHMRPALDAQGPAAVPVMAEYLMKRLTKEGIDLPHVTVEGDE